MQRSIAMRTARWVLGVCAAPVLSAALVGCVVAPAQPYYGSDVVYAAPPAPYAEYIGPPPVVGYVWINGYWNWVGSRHVWVGGHWTAPPQPGYRWVPHRWQQDGRGWRMHPGHWDNR
jgi:hypothetical protein